MQYQWEFRTIWLCPYTTRPSAKLSPLSPKPLVIKSDAGGGWQTGWRIRDTLAPMAWMPFGWSQDKQEKTAGWNCTANPSDRGEEKTWLCSLGGHTLALGDRKSCWIQFTLAHPKSTLGKVQLSEVKDRFYNQRTHCISGLWSPLRQWLVGKARGHTVTR